MSKKVNVNKQSSSHSKPTSSSTNMAQNNATNKKWLGIQYHDNAHHYIKKPNELENEMEEPPGSIDEEILSRIQGSIIGMALGDALGAHVEFRPHQYMVANPVKDLVGGGTWGLQKGQFTDDTSMALCLANSLIACRDFNPYDQLVRYKWWYKFGYMSSTGQCFDIGNATRQSIVEFERRQNKFFKKQGINIEDMDSPSDFEALKKFDVYCSDDGVAGNGALMRLAPVPLFFYRYPSDAVEFSGISGQITHGDLKAYDACRYYGALIVAALNGYTKDQLLDTQFYQKHKRWFGQKPLCTEIQLISEGSYKKKGGYKDGIRGKGYIVDALEAALWAFWSDNNSFEIGALAAVNLGDDTDTTAAIYGQLAGAYYGYKKLPPKWLEHVYAHKFMKKLCKWIAYEGAQWQTRSFSSQLQSNEPTVEPSVQKSNLVVHHSESQAIINTSDLSETHEAIQSVNNQHKNDLDKTSSESFTKESVSSPRIISSAVQRNDNNTSQMSVQLLTQEMNIDLSAEQQNSTQGSLQTKTPVLPSSSSQPNEVKQLDKNQSSSSSITQQADCKAPSNESEQVPIIDNNSAILPKLNTDKQLPTSDPNIDTFSITAPRTPNLDQCLQWTCDDVCDWIKSLGEIFAPYAAGFKRHNVDGRHLLNVVDEEALREFEVNSRYHCKAILYGIKELKNESATTLSPNTTTTEDQFNGDYMLSLPLTETTYPNSLSCVLRPDENGFHLKLYNQILQWLGPLPNETDIDKIELIHNADLHRMFRLRIKLTESRQRQEEFQPHLNMETNPTEREKVLHRLQLLSKQVQHNRSVSVVRVWHGCSRASVSNLLSNGFAALSKLDDGWFGRAMYFTSSAKYAAKYTNSDGCLIMCYVVLLNPFPVITDDAPPSEHSRNFRFYGKGNHSNYQCHYIPVVPVDKDTSWNFRPPLNGVQDAIYDELAVFQQDDILPQVVVHLKSHSNFHKESSRKFLSKYEE